MREKAQQLRQQRYIEKYIEQMKKPRVSASGSAGVRLRPHPSRFSGGYDTGFSRGWNLPTFSFGIELSLGIAEGLGFGFGIGFVGDSSGDSNIYLIVQHTDPLGLELGFADVSAFLSSLDADEISNSTCFTSESSVGSPYGVNVQLSGPLGGGTPNKANLGGSFTYVPHLVGAAAWRTRTFPIL